MSGEKSKPLRTGGTIATVPVNIKRRTPRKLGR
jgi:hypothetical protein